MKVMTMKDAIASTLSQEMSQDSKIMVLGENVHIGAGARVTEVLFHEFGSTRVLETPVSENAIVGGSLGLALGGMTAVAEIMSADFLFTTGNELLNDIPKWRFQHGWEGPLSVVVRAPCGVSAEGGAGPEHSQCPEAYFLHSPGLTVVVPGTPADAMGLMRSAVRSGKPTLYLEHRRLYNIEGQVPEDPDFMIPIGKAEVVREGGDVTIVAWGWMRTQALEAADELARSGIRAEVIDLRTISPMDAEVIVASVQKTGRLVVAEEAQRTGGVGAEILARVSEDVGPSVLRMIRVAMPDLPHPYVRSLELAVLPDKAKIVDAVVRVVDVPA